MLAVVRVRRLRRQRFDDAAVGDRSVLALTDHAIKFPAKRFEIPDLVVDGVVMLTGNRVDRSTGLILVVGVPE
jgi:hypothetical protein